MNEFIGWLRKHVDKTYALTWFKYLIKCFLVKSAFLKFLFGRVSARPQPKVVTRDAFLSRIARGGPMPTSGNPKFIFGREAIVWLKSCSYACRANLRNTFLVFWGEKWLTHFLPQSFKYSAGIDYLSYLRRTVLKALSRDSDGFWTRASRSIYVSISARDETNSVPFGVVCIANHPKRHEKVLAASRQFELRSCSYARRNLTKSRWQCT